MRPQHVFLTSSLALLALASYRHRRAAATAPKRVELAVKMHCASCEAHVRDVLASVSRVSSVDVDFASQTAVVTGDDVSESQLVLKLREAGREARVIGLGGMAGVVPAEVGSDEEWAAAVAEFKGHAYGHGPVLGVLRMVQISPSLCSLEWELVGLAPGSAVSVALHKTGNTLHGAQSTGGPLASGGHLGASTADSRGKARYQATRGDVVPVWEAIGRAVVVSQQGSALAAAVMARSAGVGANTGKRLCTCNGETIWEADAM